MAMFPEVQKKAQAELDAVIGSRLPTFEDRPQLPYIQAIVQEAMRWQQVTPLGWYCLFWKPFRADGPPFSVAVSHASMADDEYDGYFIPKVCDPWSAYGKLTPIPIQGSIVVGCSWYWYIYAGSVANAYSGLSGLSCMTQ